jgi:2-oxoglutarate ferredoxin oxidoreductase subunit beta
MNSELPLKYTRDDFRADQAVRWCPGCGDYAILAQMQRMMPEICAATGVSREDVVFISGIGCSSRFPYYMDTYGFHSIHGRAPALALGLKLARPELQVWVITGDGDGLSIGGNHLVHALRRNLDVKILLFNNEIYGLTKGQYSPTSAFGTRTRSSPDGVLAHPVSAAALAVAARATFVARTIDTETRHLRATLLRAATHRGSAFVEILQNCNIFNDGVFDHLKSREVRDDRLLMLEHGESLSFGANKTKCLGPARPGSDHYFEIAAAGNGPAIRHDEASANDAQVYALATMGFPEFPLPLGVLRAIERPTYESLVEDQLRAAQAKDDSGGLEGLLAAGDCWSVEGESSTDHAPGTGS